MTAFFLFVFTLLAPFSLYASAFTQDVVLQVIQEEIKNQYQLEGDQQDTVKKDVTTTPFEKKRDQARLEQQKQLGLPTDRVLTAEERIKLMREKNKKEVKKLREFEKTRPKEDKESSWSQSKISNIDDWYRHKNSERENWINEKKALLNRWANAKTAYKKKIPEYKKTLTPMSDTVSAANFNPTQTPTQVKTIKAPLFSSINLVDKAFSPGIKNQQKRPTCAAFAATRAIEILARRKNIDDPLSEQYFYWASKPKCQATPCSKRGSWPAAGFEYSRNNKKPDIPLADDCPYDGVERPGNDTQIPLSPGCQKGRVKVEKYSKTKNLKSVRRALDYNLPVIAGVTLSDNFYYNQGHVFLKDSKKKSTIDAHAKGHAILLLGYMKLPKKVAEQEGDFCYLTANSWGEGWGVGGYACLSQSWMQKHKMPLDYLVLESISI